MRYISFVFLLVLSLIVRTTPVSADPINLGTFTPDAGVSESGGVITFTEQESLADIYFYDTAFSVNPNPGTFYFNYKLTLGPENDDYLVIKKVDGAYLLEVGLNYSLPLSEPGSIDLSVYSGPTILLEFGLESNDYVTGTEATISMRGSGTGDLTIAGHGFGGAVRPSQETRRLKQQPTPPQQAGWVKERLAECCEAVH